MNKRNIQKFIKSHEKFIREELHISAEDITYLYIKDVEYRAETITSFPYKEIVIKINPKRILDEKDLLTTLLHEYAHVILAPFTHYSDKVNNHLTKKQVEALDEHMGLMEELVATNLERLFVKWVTI